MKKRLITASILIVYCAILIKVMVFKDIPDIRIGQLRFKFGGTQEGAANLLPFKTILPYLLGEKGWLIAGLNIGGNIILLVPIGFLVPFIYRNFRWKKMLALAVAVGFTIEGIQALLHVGIFDIDDIILNALGVMIGYWLFGILANLVHSRKYKTIVIASIIVIAAAVVSLYLIYPRAERPVNTVRATERNQSARIDSGESKISQGIDPCNGTGGTGQIVSVGNNTITIKRRDGVNQIIKLTDQTKISTSMGPASASDLKMGNRVTVVIDDSETATIVLVCNVASQQNEK